MSCFRWFSSSNDKKKARNYNPSKDSAQAVEGATNAEVAKNIGELHILVSYFCPQNLKNFVCMTLKF